MMRKKKETAILEGFCMLVRAVAMIIHISGVYIYMMHEKKETAILEGFYMLVRAVAMIIHISGVYICICRKIYIVRH